MATQAQDAAQGRRIAHGLGDDITKAPFSEAQWADYGRRAATSMARGDSVPHAVEAPATQPAGAPTRPAPAPRAAAPSRSSGGGRSYNPVGGSGPLTRLVVAVIAGLVVLELGSLVTGQYFTFDFGKGKAAPAKSATPTAFKPLVTPAATTKTAVTTQGAATGTHETG